MNTIRAILTGILLAGVSQVYGQTPDWSVDATQFEHSMFITAVVINGEGNELAGDESLVAAFIDEEVRGVAELSYESGLDRYFAYLLIHSNTPGETITFKAYDAENDRQFDLIQTITFEIDASLGDLNSPQELLSNELSGESELLTFDIDGIISEVSFSDNDVSVFLKEEVDMSSLVASFTLSEGATATVDGVVQVSSQSTADFTSALVYEVTSANRLNTTAYTIDVTVGPYPEISGVNDLSVEEGESFGVLELNDFESVYEDAEVEWSFTHTGELVFELNSANQLNISTPDENWYGVDTLSLIVTHSEYPDLSDSTGIVLEVVNVNDVPVFETEPITMVFVDSLYEYAVSVDDIDSETLTLELVSGPDWLSNSISGNSGTLFGVPVEIGNYDVTVTVSDGLASNSQNFTIVVSDRIIALVQNNQYEIDEGAAFDTIFLSSLVLETEFDPVTFQITGSEDLTYQLNGDTLLVDTPNDDFFGEEVWQLEVISGVDPLAQGQTTLNFIVNDVNDVPSFESTPTTSVFQDSLYQYQVSASDIDSESLTFELAEGPEWLSSSFDGNSGTVFGVPTEVGTFPITLTVSDGIASVQQVYSLQVADRIISLEQANNYEIEEGAAFDTILLSSLVLETELAPYTYRLSGAEELSILLSNDTLIVETPSTDYYGEETLDLEVRSETDPLALGQSTLNFVVRNVNDVPLITSTPVDSAKVGIRYHYEVVASDVDGDDLQLSVGVIPEWMTFTVVGNAGILSGVPTEAGSVEIDLFVTDGEASVTQNFTVLIALGEEEGGNLPPIRLSEIQDQIINEGRSFDEIDLDGLLQNRASEAINWNVLRSGTELEVTLTGATLAVSPPDEDWNGLEAITIIASDTMADGSSVEQVVLFEVNPINDPPEITGIPVEEIVAGDYFEYEVTVSDIDGDALDYALSLFPDWLRIITTPGGALLFGDHPDDGSESFSVSLAVTDGTVIIRQEFMVEVRQRPLNASIDLSKDLIIYPNPVTEVLFIDVQLQGAMLSITNLSGIRVREIHLLPGLNQIEVSDLARGTYLVKLSGTHSSELRRLLIR